MHRWDDPSFEVFIFALGTAPMFFLLLMVRDLVGVQSQARVRSAEARATKSPGVFRKRR